MKASVIHITFIITIFAFGILFGQLTAPSVQYTEPQADMVFSQNKNTLPEKNRERVFLLISSGKNIDVFSVSDKNEPYLYNTIEYIDLNSIDDSFKNELKSGVSVKGEIALANYIQDLDS